MQKIGKYEILGTIGRGAMGLVYKGRDSDIGRHVAIKTLRKVKLTEYKDSAKVLERFKAEARSAGNLRHPNIITVFEANIEDQLPYIVMDLVEGKSLDHILATNGKLSLQATLQLLEQLAGALDYAHQQGVVHRDIKPSNLIINSEGRVFILDFGIAYLDNTFAETHNTKSTKSVAGTPGYMSPEQIQNKSLDGRSDLFSLAVVIFECLSGKRPFSGKDVKEISENILNAKPIDLNTLVNVNSDIKNVIEKALSKNKDERFQNAKELYHRLQEAIKSSSSTEELNANNNSSKHKEANDNIWKSIPSQPVNKKAIAENTEQKSNPLLLKQTNAGAGTLYEHMDDSIGLFKRQRTSKSFIITVWFITISCSVLVYLVLFSPDLTSVLTDNNHNVENKTEVVIQTKEEPTVTEQSIVGNKNTELNEYKNQRLVTELNDSELVLELVNTSQNEQSTLDALLEAERRHLAMEIIDKAVQLVAHDSLAIRIEVLKVLGRLKNSNATPVLLSALDDHDPTVRITSAQSLGSIGSRKALAYLSARLVSESVPQVKVEIEKAITKINGF